MKFYNHQVPQEDTMEELNVCSLPSRKESAVPLTGKRDRDIYPNTYPLYYPLALLLRLRVLQIVCGISTTVMGSVAYIEERQFNMGLGILAGGLCCLAAAVSIHTSKDVSTLKRAGASSVAFGLWIVTSLLLLALLVLCSRTIYAMDVIEYDDDILEEITIQSVRDLIIIASVQIILTITSLLSAAICVWIEHTSCG